MLYSMHFQDQTSLQLFLREGKKTWDGVDLRIEPGKSSMLSRLLGPPAPYLTFCGSFPSEPGMQQLAGTTFGVLHCASLCRYSGGPQDRLSVLLAFQVSCRRDLG